jgi:myo-inositol-1(or 4)-monophosphatase
MDLKNLCIRIEEIASETAAFIMKESEGFDRTLIKTKGLHDLVSYVDQGAEKIIVEKLGNLLPEAGFEVEEGTSSKIGERYCWVVDPLDGTTNFLHNLHPFAISIALRDADEVVAGVVFEAGGQDTFSAWKNGGAWLNGKKMQVSLTTSLSQSLVATGFPFKEFSRLDGYFKVLEHLLKRSEGVRRFGSASIDLAYVACGRFEAFYEYDLKPWDVAAGTILVREAGGIVSDFSGNMKNINGMEIVAANKLVYNEFLEIVSKFMKTN